MFTSDYLINFPVPRSIFSFETHILWTEYFTWGHVSQFLRPYFPLFGAIFLNIFRQYLAIFWSHTSQFFRPHLQYFEAKLPNIFKPQFPLFWGHTLLYLQTVQLHFSKLYFARVNVSVKLFGSISSNIMEFVLCYCSLASFFVMHTLCCYL
jgi:hypothetical protein